MDWLAGCVARRSTSIQGELAHAVALNPIKAGTIRESQVGAAGACPVAAAEALSLWPAAITAI